MYPVNLGNPAEMSIMEFAKSIRARFGSNLAIDEKPLPSDDPKKRRPDISKAKRILNWEPTVTLDDGLKVTIEYFQNLTKSPSALQMESNEPVDVPSVS